VAACLAVAVQRFVPESDAQPDEPIDWPGVLLLAGAVAGVMLAISEGNDWGWWSARVVGLEAAGGLLTVAFVARERIAAQPLVHLRAITSRPMWTANLAVFVIGFSFVIAYALVPLIAGYPKVTGYGLGLTTTQIALVMTPAALANLAGGLLAGPLARPLGARNLAMLGAAFAATGYVLLIALHHTIAGLAISMIPLGLGFAMSVSAITDLVVISAAAGQSGVIIGLNNVIRSIGTALGPQVGIAVVTATSGLVPGLPARSGFTHAFVMAAIATAATTVLLALVPGPRSDPLVRPRPVLREDG
jgi:MFS family permease